MRSIFLAIYLLSSVLAPFPPGVATNPQTNECGEFDGGDEYGGYVLSSPWEVSYSVDLSSYSTATTYEERIREYCEQMGYSYVPGNLGMIYGHEGKSVIFYIGLIIMVLPILIILAFLSFGASKILNGIQKRKEPQ